MHASNFSGGTGISKGLGQASCSPAPGKGKALIIRHTAVPVLVCLVLWNQIRVMGASVVFAPSPPPQQSSRSLHSLWSMTEVCFKSLAEGLKLFKPLKISQTAPALVKTLTSFQAWVLPKTGLAKICVKEISSSHCNRGEACSDWRNYWHHLEKYRRNVMGHLQQLAQGRYGGDCYVLYCTLGK